MISYPLERTARVRDFLGSFHERRIQATSRSRRELGWGGGAHGFSLGNVLTVMCYMSEILDFLGVPLDELPPGLDPIAHERGESVLRVRDVDHGHLQKPAPLWVHGGFPELLRVHFAQTFIALDGRAGTAGLAHDSRSSLRLYPSALGPCAVLALEEGFCFLVSQYVVPLNVEPH